MEANKTKQDPLVRIKQQEVDLRAMDMQARGNKFKQDQENKDKLTN